MECVLRLIGDHGSEVDGADHAFEDERVVLGEQADDAPLRVRQTALFQYSLARVRHLLAAQGFLLAGRPLLYPVQPVFEDCLPVCCVEHIRQVLNGVWALGERVQDHVPGEAHFDLLEDQGALGDHQDWHVAHLIKGSLPLAFFLVGVLADHGHLGIFTLEVGLEAHKVKVAWHEQHRVPCACLVDALPERFDEQLVARLVCMLKRGDRWDSLQSHHQSQLFGQLQSSIGLQPGQRYSAKDIVRAMLLQGCIHVNVAEFLDDNVLSEELRVGLRSTYIFTLRPAF